MTTIIDEETYLTQHGASRQDIGDSALHKNIGTGRARKQAIERQRQLDTTLLAKREALRQEYRAKVSSGEVRSPTRTEKLLATAGGNPDNESVQAARRLLEKQGMDWRGAAIPKASEGMPEAGLQVDMSGKTTPVMPKGKARYATASMDAFDKLQKARAEYGTISREDASEITAGLDLRIDELDRRIDEGNATVESIKGSLDPKIAKLTELIPTTKEGGSEITHITKGKYQKVWGKAPPASIVTGGKVRWEYALDTIAQELHLEGKAQTEGKNPDEYLKGLIEDAKDTKALIRATQAEVESDTQTLKAIEKIKAGIKGSIGTTTSPTILQTLAKPKLKGKPKPERKAEKMVASVAQALIAKIQGKRSARAVAIDNSLLAVEVVPMSKAETWAKRPNRLDIRGVDTPKRGRVKAGVAYADRKGARLSRTRHKGFKRIKYT